MRSHNLSVCFIREALAEPAEEVSKEQFEKTMAAIADGR
jgi:hypothetical protein